MKVEQMYTMDERIKFEKPTKIKEKKDHKETSEMQEIKECIANFGHKMNVEIYQQFFRSFCRNKDAAADYMLRADFKSFSQGIEFWYGRPNEALSKLLYNYFGFGKVNHTITFSQFIIFIREL